MGDPVITDSSLPHLHNQIIMIEIGLHALVFEDDFLRIFQLEILRQLRGYIDRFFHIDVDDF
jgi:hypothetical protein